MAKEIKTVVYELLDNAGGTSLLKSSKNVYIKSNGIDGKAYCFTRLELVRADNVYALDNSSIYKAYSLDVVDC